MVVGTAAASVAAVTWVTTRLPCGQRERGNQGGGPDAGAAGPACTWGGKKVGRQAVLLVRKAVLWR